MVAIPRKRYTVLAILAFVMMVVSACYGSGADQSAKPAVAAPSSAASTTSGTLDVSPTPLVSYPPTTAPQFQGREFSLPYQSGRIPLSGKIAGRVDVEGYMQSIVKSNQSIWSAAAQKSNLYAPALSVDVTSRSDQYASRCQADGKPVVVSTNTPYMLYCSLDGAYGGVALPAGIFAPTWKAPNVDRKTADLAVAAGVSRQISASMVNALQKQLSAPTISGKDLQYMMSCTAGAWAHAVYPPNYFSEHELATGLELSLNMSSWINGQVVSVKSDQQAVTAWVVGFRSGNIAECGRQFWK